MLTCIAIAAYTRPVAGCLVIREASDRGRSLVAVCTHIVCDRVESCVLISRYYRIVNGAWLTRTIFFHHYLNISDTKNNYGHNKIFLVVIRCFTCAIRIMPLSTARIVVANHRLERCNISPIGPSVSFIAPHGLTIIPGIVKILAWFRI